ncbi:hypothetical protein [Vibrio hannami]
MPAVTGIEDILLRCKDGESITLDGGQGKIWLAEDSR